MEGERGLHARGSDRQGDRETSRKMDWVREVSRYFEKVARVSGD